MKLVSRSSTSTTLSEIMGQRSKRDQFVVYLREKEKSIENLNFVLWYEDYSIRFQYTPPAQQRREIESIIETYFDSRSISEVNIDQERKLDSLNQVRQCFESNASIPPRVFENIYRICLNLLETSSIPAFLSYRKAERMSFRTILGLRETYSISRSSSSSTS
ncbi:hypothetical protein E3P92_03951 [Wallemia ichthyophaga]|uniref:RGS domain-containing protein n=2 Tax=Wallemia ichthyophaga TaxID=245174 RepID=A0A4T0G1Q2_WALIC|nr:uncharacterized protein J056_002873 [Wallemia ichthyophaga EXF-994]TIA68646.1 hypothetical protein E3P91_03985 [Wallemia ichthyophaga]EOQ98763.1 hypothetical protein J056_002873 [Wallemia ichthyophaga EXF-994]TIA87388.1 hypothetical protein E3P97_03972 [Wallemia ichthyophaga]TIA94971.1 hypothetical protein E3P95_03953 [Wallemia ichthyophaga]TIA95774.1 hypothetical protein E3P94_03948 [Wallemia ichthyophaga]